MTLKKLLLLTTAASILNGATPVDQNGNLQLIDNQLCNQGGNPIQLRGMSTHGIQYFNSFYTRNAFEALATEWDADIIRISSYVNEGWPTTYIDDPSYWRSRIDELVDYATEFGMYAMIDWHMLGPGDPNVYIDEAKEFWKYMAQTHGGKKNVLFDICNEPNNHDAWDPDFGASSLPYEVTWSLVKQYADQIIPIIRANDPDNATNPNIVIVGTPDWASSPNKVIGNRIDDDNTMYSMHFYANDKDADPFDFDDPVSYINKFNEALDAGIPIFVTEWGTQDASGGGTNNWTTSQKWIDIMKENKISWCNWNFSADDLSGAAFIEDVSLYSVADYADSSNLKESGKWIMDKIKYPADEFGTGYLPMIELIGGVTGTTMEKSPEFAWRGTDEDGSIVAYYVGFDTPSPTIELDPSVTTYSPSSPLNDGTHTFYLVAKDSDGNFSSTISQPFFVSETGSSDDNLVINGDFSEPFDNNWNLSISGTGNGYVTNEEFQFEISYGGSNPWDMQLTQTGIKIEQGKEYIVTFRAKAETARSMKSTVFSEETYSDYTPAAFQFDLTTSFQEFEYLFLMKDDTDPSATIAFDFGGEAGDISLDDIVLKEKAGGIIPTASRNSVHSYRTFNLGQNMRVMLPVNAKVESISVIDIRGRELFSQEITTNGIDLSTALTAQGVYLIQIQTDMGIVHSKIIR